MPPRVALVSGFWGQNIGNAFFNVGGRWLLDKVFGPGEVEYIQDQPGYRTFHNQTKGNPKNDWVLLRHLDLDYIVLQGPILTTTFRALWEPTFKALTNRGTKIILLSAALFRHTAAEIEHNRAFLKRFPPVILATRDHETYEAFRELCPLSHSGIDSAFFVSDAYRPFKLNGPPNVVVNYDRYPEPHIWTSRSGLPEPAGRSTSFEALDRLWALSFPHIPYRFSDRGKWQGYLGALLDFRRRPSRIDEFEIVRTQHRVNPHVTWKVYRRPHVVASDEPFTYFTVYANSQLTLSDRVHACIATLAYGKPAMLTTNSPRSRLFDRLGLDAIRRQAVTLDPALLRREKQSLVTFLRDAVAEVES